MRYFIGYLIKGQAKQYHNNLCSNLANEFGIKYLPYKVPSHLTLKAPFETEDITQIEKILEQFSEKNKKSKLELEGFGHFGNRVIFIGVKPNEKMKEGYSHLLDSLKKVDGLTWSEFEGKGANFHATIATKGIEEVFEEMWGYISTLEKPHFELDFDNIALLKYEAGKWLIHKEYSIN
ncbi:2'-5' RNA ligase family protein [Candidatus Pacearchaeota archaeon]|nr:2'-5' RNA ligase family protein [Candidatus Pacearchaeota archaeon]